MSDQSSQAMKEFISETEEIIGSLNLDLVKLADSLETGDSDPDLINGNVIEKDLDPGQSRPESLTRDGGLGAAVDRS